MKTMAKIGKVVLMALVISSVIFAVQLIGSGARDLGALTNKHGIPYPIYRERVQVYESLAHTDLFLKEPVLGKELLLTVTFNPKEMRRISVGVRENSFWLSYPWVTLYEGDSKNGKDITKTVRLPLTDRLQDADRSVDIMFLGETQTINGEGLADQTDWEVVEIRATVKRDWPSWAAFKNYGRSLIDRERAL